MSVDPAKVDKIRQILQPTSVKKLQTFLGLCNYYSKFIENFAAICRPLHKLTGKDVEWVWDDASEHAFQTLKGKLTTTPVLAMPDFGRKFIMHTDASKERVGAVLTQYDEQVKESLRGW